MLVFWVIHSLPQDVPDIHIDSLTSVGMKYTHQMSPRMYFYNKKGGGYLVQTYIFIFIYLPFYPNIFSYIYSLSMRYCHNRVKVSTELGRKFTEIAVKRRKKINNIKYRCIYSMLFQLLKSTYWTRLSLRYAMPIIWNPATAIRTSCPVLIKVEYSSMDSRVTTQKPRSNRAKWAKISL